MTRRSSSVKAKASPTRNSSIELLRIISMIMIVFHHFAVHGGFNWYQGTMTIPHLWYNLIAIGGKLGVDIFVLISGYFLIKDRALAPSIKKILIFWGQIVFYSIAIYASLTIVGLHEFRLDEFLQSFAPITFQTWWFASTYFVLYLLHPFLNKFLHSLSKKRYQYFLITTFICWSVIPTLSDMPFESNQLLWFITVYAIAGYIRLYGFNKKLKSKHFLITGLSTLALAYLSSIIYIKIATLDNGLMPYITYFYGPEKLTIIIAAICIFMFFKNLDLKYNKWINLYASATFGVYLIHDHTLMRPVIWEKLFKNYLFQFSGMIIPYSIAAVLAVYCVCTVVDMLRQKTVEKPWQKLVECHGDKLLKPCQKLHTFLKRHLF